MPSNEARSTLSPSSRRYPTSHVPAPRSTPSGTTPARSSMSECPAAARRAKRDRGGASEATGMTAAAGISSPVYVADHYVLPDLTREQVKAIAAPKPLHGRPDRRVRPRALRVSAGDGD